MTNKITEPFVGPITMGICDITLQGKDCQGLVYKTDFKENESGYADIRVPIMLNKFAVIIYPDELLSRSKKYYARINFHGAEMILNESFDTREDAKDKAKELYEDFIDSDSWSVIDSSEIE